MTTLYALCRPNTGATIKHVVLNAAAQGVVKKAFDAQYADFVKDITHSIPFTGNWKPPEDQLLTLPLDADATAMVAATKANAAATPTIDAKNFEQEHIKALFIAQPNGRVLVQNFSTQQLVLTRAVFILDGQTFKNMEQPAFSVSNSLVAVIEGQAISFKSFLMLSRILDLSQHNVAATNVDIDKLAKHSKLHIPDLQNLKTNANQTTRKSLHAILQSGILDKVPVKTFASEAASLGVALKTSGGKIQFPSDPAEMRDVLNFLQNKIYQGPLDKLVYVANDKRLK